MDVAVAEQVGVCPRCRSQVAVEAGALVCCLRCAEIYRATETGALETVDAAALPPDADILGVQASILRMQRDSARLTQRWAGQH